MKIISIVIIISMLFNANVINAEEALPTVELIGSTPAPPDKNEKGFVAALLGIYYVTKSTVKWLNRCYATYKGIIFTYKEIEGWCRNFDDYWADVYGKFESAYENMQQGNVFETIYGFEDVFRSVDNFFINEVGYMNNLLNRDLAMPLKGVENPMEAAKNSSERALKIIEMVYDNTRHLRTLDEARDIASTDDPFERREIRRQYDRAGRRRNFEWALASTASCMQMAGTINSQMEDIKYKMDDLREINKSAQSVGECFAIQRNLLQSLYEIEIASYQISIANLETQKNSLSQLNNSLYAELHAKAGDFLAIEAFFNPDQIVDPFQGMANLGTDFNDAITQMSVNLQ